MKMGKLFSSIAAATMVLTTLAPVAVANAATGYPVTDEGVGSASSSAASLPVATASGENSNDGSATAKSDASVNVIDGYLILQSVPNFGFGAAIAGSTADLVNYKKAGHAVNDGSESGLLTIIDSRHSALSSTSPMDGMGFNLSVSLGKFQKSSIPSATTPAGSSFVLNFKRTGTQLAEMGNNHQLQVTPGRVVENNSFQLLNEPSTKTGGTHTWQFTGNDVSLTIPDGIAKGQWYSTITWTLGGKAV